MEDSAPGTHTCLSIQNLRLLWVNTNIISTYPIKNQYAHIQCVYIYVDLDIHIYVGISMYMYLFYAVHLLKIHSISKRFKARQPTRASSGYLQDLGRRAELCCLRNETVVAEFNGLWSI